METGTQLPLRSTKDRFHDSSRIQFVVGPLHLHANAIRRSPPTIQLAVAYPTQKRVFGEDRIRPSACSSILEKKQNHEFMEILYQIMAIHATCVSRFDSVSGPTLYPIVASSPSWTVLDTHDTGISWMAGLGLTN